MLALTENLRLGRIFPAVICTGPKGSQLAIAEPTAGYFSIELTFLVTEMSGKVSSDPQPKLTQGTHTQSLGRVHTCQDLDIAGTAQLPS